MSEKTGERPWCAGSDRSTSISSSTSSARGSADLDPVRKDELPRRDLLQPVRVLLAEADPEPRVDERGVTGGNERVMARAPVLHPALGRSRVQVAEILRLLDCVAGELDPDVLAPDPRLQRSADQVADYAPIPDGGRAGCLLRAPRLFDLGPRRHRALEARRKRRLGLALARVAGGEEPAGVVQMPVGKGDYFEARHGT